MFRLLAWKLGWTMQVHVALCVTLATAALQCGPQKVARSCNTLGMATSSGYQLVTTLGRVCGAS